ncbi:MAG: ribonuclease P protein component [Candidatus Omnitrophota bacterium]|nr:ribonuclease P protein component [Candidatus Omnitrophota bacterium]
MIPDDRREPQAKPRDEGFAKHERLIKTKDFRKVYKDGRSYKAGFVVLRLLPNAASTNRIGFSISAKSIKRALRRNRIKRLFREVYRRNKKILKKGFDIVFVVRKDTKKNFSYIEAQQVFLDLSKQADILL